jgi:hypothetical protein
VNTYLCMSICLYVCLRMRVSKRFIVMRALTFWLRDKDYKGIFTLPKFDVITMRRKCLR